MTVWKEYQKRLAQSTPFDAATATRAARSGMIVAVVWGMFAIATQQWLAIGICLLLGYREWSSRYIRELIQAQAVLLDQYLISLVEMEAEIQTFIPALDASHEVRTQYDQLKQDHHDLIDVVSKLVYKLQAKNVPGFMALEEARNALAEVKKYEDQHES